MLDIKWIRENAKALDEALAARNIAPRSSFLLELDKKRRAHIALLQDMQTRRNRVSGEIGRAQAAGNQAQGDILKQEMAALKTDMVAAADDDRRLSAAFDEILAELPNIPAADVPFGRDEKDNVELHRFGRLPEFDFLPKEHFELGEALGLMNFERAARLSGARFTVLSGALAQMERALGQFMLDMHTREHGYCEVSVPLLVRDEAVFGTAQLPKFAEDLFQTLDGRWLIPTAEVPLTNLVNGEIVEKAALPLRFAALGPCFRSEAGSAGRDTRGMLRQHQFWKVEMVVITTAEESAAEHERMTHCAEAVLKKLGLPFRTQVLCSGDMGFSARKTYDIEVWLPGQKQYREISSCSNCGDFQARRMNARYRLEGEKGLQFVHTLNGSGTAVGRCLIAVMENYQQKDGTISIPEVLQPYMGGLDHIG
ncbi:serine--tRNA ligase [Candidatus Tokpelaia sp.]|uniref:serine--tRNA ligase n=1 Tax=Candidatus Tokpelaia sp. TaxID=2233777 RepID=UPI00123BB318|nr:serine--tRNA ligase [Candidatus Tokpelaia sp.]KAA6404864.1 serine--tRNA ligase [Candidatus Tokpelaia sp.]